MLVGAHIDVRYLLADTSNAAEVDAGDDNSGECPQSDGVLELSLVVTQALEVQPLVTIGMGVLELLLVLLAGVELWR